MEEVHRDRDIEPGEDTSRVDISLSASSKFFERLVKRRVRDHGERLEC